MTRRERLHAASGKAMAAADALILLAAYESTDKTPPLASLIEAEAALYAAIDLIWQANTNPRLSREEREEQKQPERMVA